MSEQQPQSTGDSAATARRVRSRFDYGTVASSSLSAAIKTHAAAGGEAAHFELGVALALTACVLMYASLFLSNFSALESVWSRDPSWSHGYGIPILAAVLVWMHWDR